MTLFDRLKSEAARDWADYTEHEVLRQLEAGTLPLAAFRSYLIQDYLFLIQFARANALAAYKGHTLDDLIAGQRGLAAIIEETELHVRLCAGWGLSRDDLNAAAEHPATIAYTRYVLDAGLRGDLLDIHVALSPCTIGYAEIGSRLKPVLVDNPDHPYAKMDPASTPPNRSKRQPRRQQPPSRSWVSASWATQLPTPSAWRR